MYRGLTNTFVYSFYVWVKQQHREISTILEGLTREDVDMQSCYGGEKPLHSAQRIFQAPFSGQDQMERELITWSQQLRLRGDHVPGTTLHITCINSLHSHNYGTR